MEGRQTRRKLNEVSLLSLPDDVVNSILMNIETKELMKIRTVCKKFNTVMKEKWFIQKLMELHGTGSKISDIDQAFLWSKETDRTVYAKTKEGDVVLLRRYKLHNGELVHVHEWFGLGCFQLSCVYKHDYVEFGNKIEVKSDSTAETKELNIASGPREIEKAEYAHFPVKRNIELLKIDSGNVTLVDDTIYPLFKDLIKGQN